jgi:phage terminase large subunit GpA-like protein
MMLIANAQRLGLETVAAALEPPPPVDLLAWAERNIVFDDGPFPGRYSRQLFPFFDEVLKALGPDDPARFVTLCGSAQVGKTVLGLIFALGSMTVSRGSFLYVHPTSDNALRWSKMKLSVMMKSTAVVREQFPQRSRDSLASILYKERVDGLARLLITGANSPASLSQVTIDAQVQDDLSKYEPNNMGDPELMADSRSRAIADAKIFKISTPLVTPGCRITNNYMAGSQEQAFVPCPHCSTMQILEWENMLAALDPADPDSACFTCVECGGVIEEYHRPQMLAGFEWRAANPAAAKEHRSFAIWSAYSYLQSWSQIAREWLRAKGDPAGEKVFHNDVLGKAYETRGDGRPWEELRDRALKSHYGRGEVPKGCLLLFLGIDVQLDRCEWVLIGCGQRYQRFIIDVGTVGKHVSEPDAQRHLDQLLDRTLVNSVGRPMSITLAAIDGGYSTDDVLQFARRHPTSRLIAVRGVHGDAAPRISRVQRERNEKLGTLVKYSRRFFNVGVNVFKLALYKDLAKDDSTLPGFISFPRDLPDRFYQELTSETRVAHKRMGQIVWKWEKPDRAKNECLDCTIYASAAAIKYGVNWISDVGWRNLEADLETPLPPSGALPPSQRERDGKRIVRIVEQLPK